MNTHRHTRNTRDSRFRGAALAAAILIAISVANAAAQAQASRPQAATNGPRPANGGRVQALFLGDNGHHQPYARAKAILPILAHRGIDLFYTDQPSDLNPDELSRYHVLVLYNNHTNVTRPQLNALLNFVQNGGGLVVLHCASASFQNSEEFIRLVGAAFKSHGTGVFKPTTVASNHAVMRNVADYEAWDETYIHTKHNPNRTVLAVRREGGHDEPWTWVRDYGKGRVFYTASGHDQRVWGTAGFQQLVDNAIKWTAGVSLTVKASEPVVAKMKLAVPLPVYRQDTVWNVLADKHVDSAQVGVSPEVSFALTTLRPGLKIQLFAAEPMINNIIDFAWDSRGRMWAVETNDYPNNVLPDSVKGNDRVIILEDTNGDGKADKKTIFADGMNLATSLVLANGGVIVGQAPHMLYFRDTNGDNKADERKILFTGWPRNDTHGTISNMRWGFDNQIWGSVGYNGFRGTVGNVTYDRQQNPFGAGYFRFPTDISTLDYVARTSNNTWGLGFTEDGYAFGSTANSQPSAFVHIPARYYRSIGVNNPVLPRIHDRNDIYPVRDVLQVDQFGRYTAGAAHEIYTARSFPEEYWNKMAFVAEPTGHLVGMFELIPNGSGFIAKNRWNLMASRDMWSAPVQVKVGPDGAVWVSDFYSLVAQHNPDVRGMTATCCRAGPGAAYETPNRDTVHGRIYRISYERAPRYTPMRLDNAPPAQLVAALKNDNMFWRMTAQQRLVEGKHTAAIPALIRLLNDQTVDELGLNPGALHALWTLDGLGALKSSAEALQAARGALSHPAAALRRAALQVLPRDERLANDIFAAGLLPDRTSPWQVEYTVGSNILQDADAQVRLTALLALSELPASPRTVRSILDLMAVPANARDPWLPDAAAIAGAKQGPQFLQDFLRQRAPQDTLALAGIRNAAVMMTRYYVNNVDANALVGVLTALPQANQVIGNAVLAAIAPPPPPQGRGGGPPQGQRPGWPEDRQPTLTAEQKSAISAAVRAAPAELAEAYARVGQRWGMPEVFARN